MDQTKHNHPPRCCCVFPPGLDRPSVICPVCPGHGELANLSVEPGSGPCPSCHQLAQRPPTDYCRTPEWHNQ